MQMWIGDLSAVQQLYLHYQVICRLLKERFTQISITAGQTSLRFNYKME